MKEYKILLVEDTPTSVDACSDAIEVMNGLDEYDIKLEIADNYGDALIKLEDGCDVAIIDIKFNGDKDGNDLIKEITKKFRIPIAIMTGNPGLVDGDISFIKQYVKGDAEYDSVLKELFEIHETVFISTLGVRGLIEKKMNEVFWDNLYPQLKIWTNLEDKYSPQEQEIILLRYTISHIQELIDETITEYCCEEAYIIKKRQHEELKTGCILKCKKSAELYIVLTPPCDLVDRGSNEKNQLLLCKIEELEKECKEKVGDATAYTTISSRLSSIIKNSKGNKHWLPTNSRFAGGVIDFEKMISYSFDEIKENFDVTDFKVQNSIIKNVLSRFSNYYSRQGQPDFDFEYEMKKVIKEVFPSCQIPG